jgi:hypothetical protein
MRISEAKAAARQWVLEEGARLPGFRGAYYAGSATWLPDDAELAPSSDLDVMLVLGGSEPPPKPGRLIYQGVLLEVSCLASRQIQSPEQVLADYHLAGPFRQPNLISDPTGELARLQAAVGPEYPRREWVVRRCEHARRKIVQGLRGLDSAAPFHDPVMTWLFPAGITTHVLLAAGLRNPTVRRRYAAVRELLLERGRPELYETLLELLGCAQLGPDRVRTHLQAMADAFDTAKQQLRSPFPFASDLTDVARPIAVEGSRELIERGLHREAVFWIAVTYARCRKVLHEDAPPELRNEHEEGFRRLLADLGIGSFDDLLTRSRRIQAFLPELWEVAQQIMAATAAIQE